MRFLSLMLSIILFITLTGCATIIHGKSQEIFVDSRPPGAIVRVNNSATATPGRIMLDRSKPRYTLIFEKENYRPVTVELQRGLDGWLFGNILFGLGGVIGLAVDFLTGSAYKIRPSEVTIDFEERQ